MSDSSFPCDYSYEKVVEDLNRWRQNIIMKLDGILNCILSDMNTTSDHVHRFASFTETLLFEYEKQLINATTSEEIYTLEKRINYIISEVDYLHLLFFQLNCPSIQLRDKLDVKYHDREVQSIDSSWISTFCSLDKTFRTISDSSIPNKQSILSSSNYRFLISRCDTIELNKISLFSLHLTSFDNVCIDECVLTFHAPDLDSFVHAFATYWKNFPKSRTVRLLLSASDLSLIMNTTGDRLICLAKRFQLSELKVSPDFCPNSDEKLLLISGKRRDRIVDCIEEIYYNIEMNKRENIQFYDLVHMSINDIERRNRHSGSFLSNRDRNHSNDIDNVKSSDKREDWWTARDNRSEIIQREISVTNIQAGVIIGLNASRIDQVKQNTGAYVYINGDMKDLKRTVFIKGTHEQTQRAYVCITDLLDRHKNGQLPLMSRSFNDKHKGK
ncbi:unnamed protein product [Adineta ricciae]|uniref:K Homology domain-containing protein n=1 Tax=Adineta ricciae TaxID=249248 RepID=A0A815CC81_ADIRI|nr:unnamed protein product [Adineta ricciae]